MGEMPTAQRRPSESVSTRSGSPAFRMLIPRLFCASPKSIADRKAERPHKALNMKCPVEIYQPCTRPYTGLPDIDYPFHDKTLVVTRCGRICLGKKKTNFSQVFALA
jgi:hypothetical protein